MWYSLKVKNGRSSSSIIGHIIISQESRLFSVNEAFLPFPFKLERLTMQDSFISILYILFTSIRILSLLLALWGLVLNLTLQQGQWIPSNIMNILQFTQLFRPIRYGLFPAGLDTLYREHKSLQYIILITNYSCKLS